MKWLQFLLILFLLLGLPLFDMGQSINIDWVFCENSIIIESEWNGPCENEFKFTNLCFDSKLPTPFLNQVKFLFQMKNSLSILLSYFQGTSPFWRPPPNFHLSFLDHLLKGKGPHLNEDLSIHYREVNKYENG